MQRTDVVISGGGMVGLTLGLALAQGGLKTVIVDIAPPAKVLAPAFDGRVSALAYASVRMLTALGCGTIWRPRPSPSAKSWSPTAQAGKPASPFSLHFDAQEVGADSLGHIAENRHIRAALYAAVARRENLQLLAPAEVKSLTVDSGGAIIRLGDGTEIGGVAGHRRRGARIRPAQPDGDQCGRLVLSPDRHRRHGGT